MSITPWAIPVLVSVIDLVFCFSGSLLRNLHRNGVTGVADYVTLLQIDQ